jgi:hypothetical protein
MSREGVVFFLALAIAGAGYASVGLLSANAKAEMSKCSGNLRQLGLAAIQHADDRRFYPWVGDGGVDTNCSTRAVRSLYVAGYHDNPEGFVCPASSDASRTTDEAWTWRGATTVDPTSPEATDPTLAETTELSYGWTRARLNANVASTTALAADRAVRHADFREEPSLTSDDPLQGNHVGGLNVVQTDGTTMSWMTGSTEVARHVEPLAIVDPFQPRRPRALGLWERLAPEALALLPLGLIGLLTWLRGGPAPPPRPGVAPRASSSTLPATQRCPFCHDEVATAATLTRCSACRAVFHDECVPAGARCTTLGCAGR